MTPTTADATIPDMPAPPPGASVSPNPASARARRRRSPLLVVLLGMAVLAVAFGASFFSWAGQADGDGQVGLSTPGASAAPTSTVANTTAPPSPLPSAPSGPRLEEPDPGSSRGYLTTPAELERIAARADAGQAPFADIVEDVLAFADEPWRHDVERNAQCPSADDPEWLDDEDGAPLLYAKAIAYHLTGDDRYANEVRDGLEQIMSRVERIDLDEQRCRLVFGWGTPELVAAADLIEAVWIDDTCAGPTSFELDDDEVGEGPCKELFQNWLVKHPYYVVSYTGFDSQSNWGAAATTAMATIADYLWDRPEVELVHREPHRMADEKWDEHALSPADAYELANRLALDRMNGYRVELHSSEACDYLSGDQQSDQWPPVKSQITELGIIPEDARRDEFCNIPVYDGSYQNYPQIHLGNLIQQCELMLRRGDSRCYDNVDESDVPDYTFVGPDGEDRTTHLRPGRGSLERAINAVIVDSDTDWRRPSALAVAYRYYATHGRLGEVEHWREHLDSSGATASQDLSFGTLTHALAEGEEPARPPLVAPPRAEPADEP